MSEEDATSSSSDSEAAQESPPTSSSSSSSASSAGDSKKKICPGAAGDSGVTNIGGKDFNVNELDVGTGLLRWVVQQKQFQPTAKEGQVISFHYEDVLPKGKEEGEEAAASPPPSASQLQAEAAESNQAEARTGEEPERTSPPPQQQEESSSACTTPIAQRVVASPSGTPPSSPATKRGLLHRRRSSLEKLTDFAKSRVHSAAEMLHHISVPGRKGSPSSASPSSPVSSPRNVSSESTSASSSPLLQRAAQQQQQPPLEASPRQSPRVAGIMSHHTRSYSQGNPIQLGKPLPPPPPTSPHHVRNQSSIAGPPAYPPSPLATH